MTVTTLADQRTSWRRPALAILGASSLSVFTIWLAWLWLVPGERDPARPFDRGGNFTLEAASGPISSESLHGQVMLLYFGYTFCPDVCPTTLVDMAAMLRALSPTEQSRVQPLFVSVDPERDTPARLLEYTRYFDPRIVGATGSKAQLDVATSRFGASYARGLADEGSYVMEHPSAVYVLGADGVLVERIEHGASIERWLTVIRAALAGRAVEQE